MSTAIGKENIITHTHLSGNLLSDTASCTCSACVRPPKKKTPVVSTKVRLKAMKENSKNIKDQLSFFSGHSYYSIASINISFENTSIISIHKNLKQFLPKEIDHRLQAEVKKGIGNKKLRRLLLILIQRYIDLYSLGVNQKEEIDQQLIATHLLRDNIYQYIHDKWTGQSGFIIASCVGAFLTTVDIALFNSKQETPISSTEIEEKVLRLIKRRLDVPSVRASYNIWAARYLMTSSEIEISEDEEIVFEKILPFLAEVMVSIMYYDNQVLDGKYEVNSSTDIFENIFCANILKGVTYSYIDENISDINLKAKVLNTARKIFSGVNLGQYIDKKLNVYSEDNDLIKNIRFSESRSLKLKSIVDLIYGAKDEAKIVYPVCEELDEALQYEEIRKLFITANTGLDLSLSIQLNIYVNRISLTSTLFFTEFLELIGNLLFIPKESITPLKKHAINYGLSLQIVNDIADFIQRDTRTVGKVEADVLKDIQNKTMTLPIILHLQKGNCSHFVRHLLKNYRKKHFKPFIVKRVFKEMTDSGALQKAIEISQNVARAASIQGLNKDCLEGLYINDLQSIAFKNWYFTEIHDLIAQSATHQESLSTVKATAIVPNQNQVFAISEISNPYFNGYKWLVHQLSKVFNAIDEFITRTVDFNVTKTLERISSFVAFSYHT